MSPNDTAGRTRRDLVRVGAGAVFGAAAASAPARRTSAERSGGAVEMQDAGNETGGNESGGNETGGNESGGNETGGNQTGGDETGGNESGGDETGGTPGTPQDEGNVGEEGEEGQPPAEQTGGGTLALFGVAGVLAFLSPVALVVLMYRNARREEERY